MDSRAVKSLIDNGFVSANQPWIQDNNINYAIMNVPGGMQGVYESSQGNQQLANGQVRVPRNEIEALYELGFTVDRFIPKRLTYDAMLIIYGDSLANGNAEAGDQARAAAEYVPDDMVLVLNLAGQFVTYQPGVMAGINPYVIS